MALLKPKKKKEEPAPAIKPKSFSGNNTVPVVPRPTTEDEIDRIKAANKAAEAARAAAGGATAASATAASADPPRFANEREPDDDPPRFANEREPDDPLPASAATPIGSEPIQDDWPGSGQALRSGIA